MKKNILLIILCIFCLLGITGCGKNTEKNVNEEKNIESNDNKEKKEEKEQYTKIDVKEVLATSKNYAIIEGKDDKLYIIDKEGISQGILEEPTEVEPRYYINDNGYAGVGSYRNFSNIYDKTGKKLFESSGKIGYFRTISDSNYIIRESVVNDFNGDTKKFDVIDTEGNVIYENIPKNLEYAGGNYYYNTEVIYNVKTGKSASTDFERSFYNYSALSSGIKCTVINENVVNNDTRAILIKEDMSLKDSTGLTIINDKYYYKNADKTIYDFNDKKIKEITDGNGIRAIYYSDGKYYTVSETLYFYVMDENFNIIKEPVKLGRDVMDVNEYGVFALKDVQTRQTEIYDFDGNKKYDFGDLFITTNDNFIAKTFIDGVTNDSPLVNLYTGEELVIYTK